MKPYAAPLDDILFSLNTAAGACRIPGWDAGLAAEIGRHFAAFAEAEIAPLDAPGDAQGCRLEHGKVRMPDGFAAVYRRYAEQGWSGLTAPEAFGGQGMSAAVGAVTSEIFTGACHSLQMVVGLVPGAIRTLFRFGTADQQARLIPPLADGRWLSTMCLTEPGAGSDLSRIRCRATRDGDLWRITGEKTFISGGDQDLSEGILHLVLARTSGDGVKGLTLFACRATQEDGTRNAVSVARIEEKLGLHASPTCHLVFDGAEAELIGAEGAGLRAMFTMMNHARLDVALQGVAHAARAHDIAATYAAGRVQGRGANGPVTLDGHADVRRMLDRMDALALGARAMAHLPLVLMETGALAELVDFLTPVAKVFCTEAGAGAADMAIQVLGGYGYLREYRVGQIWRDARICAIYEGANGIHALSLATRGLRGAEGGDAFAALIGRIAAESGNAALTGHLDAWRTARRTVERAADPAPLAHDFMQATALILFLALWARIGARAADAPRPVDYARLSAMVPHSFGVDFGAACARLAVQAQSAT